MTRANRKAPRLRFLPMCHLDVDELRRARAALLRRERWRQVDIAPASEAHGRRVRGGAAGMRLLRSSGGSRLFAA